MELRNKDFKQISKKKSPLVESLISFHMSVKQLDMCCTCTTGVQLSVTAGNSLFMARTSDMGQA
jgi:hypothetical protein